MDVKGANVVIEFKIKVYTACGYACEYEHECMWLYYLPQSLRRDIRVFYLSPTLIAGSGQRKPCNPTAITTRLIDSAATERERPRDQDIDKERERLKGTSLLLCPSVSLSLTV